MINTDECLLFLKKIILQAGLNVLEIYQSNDFEIKTKNDNSPLTKADIISHEIICKALSKNYPNIPILSEESSESFSISNSDSLFWCIDPIDGTKEFIKRNDEFTINIALISNKKPILGVIYAPALDQLYYATKGKGSFYETKYFSKKIMIKKVDKNNLVFAVSRSHISEQTLNFLDLFENNSIKKIGSSLKLCGVAIGEVDCYPRFGPTSLWDIAAGHIIVNEAGGYVLDKSLNEIEYDFTKGFINSDFFAVNHFFYEKFLNDQKKHLSSKSR
jgi:3'(2'), 5'-bisphosphate nucleotidase